MTQTLNPYEYDAAMTCTHCGQLGREHCPECGACYDHAYYCSKGER